MADSLQLLFISNDDDNDEHMETMMLPPDYDDDGINLKCSTTRRRDREREQPQRYHRHRQGHYRQLRLTPEGSTLDDEMPLLTSLPLPVLAVAPDAVRHLEGGDALSGLWAVFSKCKESIQNGHRLENISWRLWYREMMLSCPALVVRHEVVYEDEKFRSEESEDEEDENESLDEKRGFQDLEAPPYRPPTPLEQRQGQQDLQQEGQTPQVDQQHIGTVRSECYVRTSYEQEREDRLLSSDLPSASTTTTTTTVTTSTTIASKTASGRRLSSVSTTSRNSRRLSTQTQSSFNQEQSSQQRRRGSFLAGSKPMNVGKIICDMTSDPPLLRLEKDGVAAPPVASGSKSLTPRSRSLVDDEDVLRRSLSEGVRRATPSSLSTPVSSNTLTSPVFVTMPTVPPIPTPSPTLPYLPIPDATLQSQSQLPTPGAEFDESIDSISRIGMSGGRPAPVGGSSDLLPPVLASNQAEQVVLQQQQPSVRLGVGPLPPSPSLSDSYVRAHPDAVDPLRVVGAEHEVGVGALSSNMSLSLGPSLSRMPSPSNAEPNMMSSVPVISIPLESVTITSPSMNTGSGDVSQVTPVLGTPSTPPTLPKLVIVNPTPGPTPQPTPPTTPLLIGGVPVSAGSYGTRQGKLFLQAGAGDAPRRQQYLVPPVGTATRTRVAERMGEVEDRDRVVVGEAGADPLLRVPPLRLGPPRVLSGSIGVPPGKTATESTVSGPSVVATPASSTTSSTITAPHTPSQPLPPPPVGSPPLTTNQPQERGKEREREKGHNPASSVTSVTSVVSAASAASAVSATSAGSSRSTRSSRSAGPSNSGARAKLGTGGRGVGGKLRRASSSGVVATTSGADIAAPPAPAPAGAAAGRARAGRGAGAGVVRIGLGARSKSSGSLGKAVGAKSKSQSRSRSRGKELAGDGGMGLAAAAIGVMTAAVVAVESGVAARSGVSAQGGPPAVTGKRASLQGFSTLTRTLSHEDVEEVSGEDEESEEEHSSEEGDTDVDEVEDPQIEADRVRLAEEEARRIKAVEMEKAREEEGRRADAERVAAVQAQIELERKQTYEREVAALKRQQERHQLQLQLQHQSAMRDLAPKVRGAGGLQVGVGDHQKRATKFNIGSNSDDGTVSAVASKSGGSGSGDASEAAFGKEKVPGPREEAQKTHQLQHLGRRPTLDQQELAVALQVEAERVERQRAEQERVREEEAQAKLNSRALEKGKGKDKDTALANLAMPLLPQTTKKKIVLATSESEYTDTDEEGDSWTSDGEDSNLSRKPPSQRSAPQQHSHTSHTRRQSHGHSPAPALPSHKSGGPHPAVEHHHQPPQRHPPRVGLHRTHSHNPATNRLLTKREQQKQAQLNIERAAAQLQREEEERQRHKDMFSKKPTSSFQNLTRLGGMTNIDGATESGLGEVQRAKSVGLLSQLMNPDPHIFPEEHPYRRGYSSGEIPRMGGRAMFGPFTSIHPGGGNGGRPQMSPIQLEPHQQLQQQQQRLLRHQEVEKEQEAARQAAQAHVKEEEERRRQLQQKQAEQRPQPQPQQRATEPPLAAQQHRRHPSQASQLSQASQRPSSTATSRSGKARQPSQDRPGPPGMVPRGMRGLGMQMSKSSAALPVASVQVASVVPNGMGVGMVERAPPTPTTPHGPTSGAAGSGTAGTMTSAAGPANAGYRPRGPPQGQELEETDSESEGEDKENHLMMSKSVAQEKLRVFAQKRGIGPPTRGGGGNGDAEVLAGVDVAPWERETERRQHDTERMNAANANARAEVNVPMASPPPSSAPIPLMHPYNLPAPAPPTTPRTTRRLMLRKEMTESFRRQLLWERQQAAPLRRSASSTATSSGYGGAQNGGSRVGALSNLRPLTSTPSMVQLHVKGSGRDDGGWGERPKNGDARGSGERDRRASGNAPPEPIEERRRRALARNPSYDNQYHTSGW